MANQWNRRPSNVRGRGHDPEYVEVHLDTTLAEAVARLTGDWAADITTFDAVHNHILIMADVLSNGILSQFPQKFAKW